MEGFCFIIADKQHRIYYASENAHLIFGKNSAQIKNQPWFSFIKKDWSKDYVKGIIQYELETNGFVNGYLNFGGVEDPLWFIDYGKRYENDGTHCGYELIITPTTPDASDYMKHFYQNLIEKVQASPNENPLDIYNNEKQLIEQTVGTDFNEFMLALQGSHD